MRASSHRHHQPSPGLVSKSSWAESNETLPHSHSQAERAHGGADSPLDVDEPCSSGLEGPTSPIPGPGEVRSGPAWTPVRQREGRPGAQT